MRVKIALGMAASAVVISMGSIGYAANNNAKRVDDVSRLAAQSQSLIETIQAERVANIRRSCEDQNDRHKKLEDTFKKLIPQKLTPKQKHQLKLFVNAIAEKRNCDTVVKQQTSKSQKKSKQ